MLFTEIVLKSSIQHRVKSVVNSMLEGVEGNVSRNLAMSSFVRSVMKTMRVKAT